MLARAEKVVAAEMGQDTAVRVCCGMVGLVHNDELELGGVKSLEVHVAQGPSQLWDAGDDDIDVIKVREVVGS